MQCLESFRVMLNRIRAEPEDKSAALIDWMMTVDERKFNGVDILELDEATKLICLTRDFCSITKFAWTTADLLMLPSMMILAGINPFDKMNGGLTYCEFALNLIGTMGQMQEPPSIPNPVGQSNDDAQELFLQCRIQEALPLLERSSDPCSKYLLGLIFFEGINVAKDMARAKKFLAIGVEQNYALSMRLAAAVGLIPWSNVRMYNDELKALASKGNVFAFYELGQYFFNLPKIVPGSKSDPKMVVRYYERAAAHGYFLAHWRASGLYATKELLDYAKAKAHAEAAAALGHGSSENRLAMIYWNGNGVERDHELAIKYYRRAVEHNCFDSLLRLAKYCRGKNDCLDEYKRYRKLIKQLADKGDAQMQGWLTQFKD